MEHHIVLDVANRSLENFIKWASFFITKSASCVRSVVSLSVANIQSPKIKMGIRYCIVKNMPIYQNQCRVLNATKSLCLEKHILKLKRGYIIQAVSGWQKKKRFHLDKF